MSKHAITEADIEVRKEQCLYFAIWACFIGMFIPSLSYFLIELINFAIGEEHGLNIFLGPLLFITPMITTIGAFIAYYKYKNKKVYTGNMILYILGVITMLLVGTIIILTGGLLRSVFSYYLIYLPSIVAVSFTDTKVGLYTVASSSLIIAIISILIYSPVIKIEKIFGTVYYVIEILIILVVQLGTICIIERQEAKSEK